MNKLILTILILANFLTANATNQYSVDNPKTIEDPSFTIEYPEDWEIDQSGMVGTTFVIYFPLESEDDNFRENINLMIQDLNGQKINLNQFTEISQEQIKDFITNSEIKESKNLKNNKREYHKIIYSGDQGTHHLMFEQYYWIVKGKAYVLTFTSTQDNFKSMQKKAEEIMNSFKILD